jgi:mRNA interferase RelE/StbE
VSGEREDEPYQLRTTSTVRRALSETLPEAVATAAYEFITGPLLADPYRIGKRLLPPMNDRFSAHRGTYRVVYRIDDKDRVVTVVDVALSQAALNRSSGRVRPGTDPDVTSPIRSAPIAS